MTDRQHKELTRLTLSTLNLALGMEPGPEKAMLSEYGLGMKAILDSEQLAPVVPLRLAGSG